jgi:hypothetical protein
MDNKTGGRVNHKEMRNKISLYPHIYRRILRKWGFKQKVPRKVNVNTASQEEKEAFKKRSPKYLWMYNSSNSSRKKDLQ